MYETVQMIELSNLQEIEVDELITKFYIEIKNSLTLALECESKAAFHPKTRYTSRPITK